MTASNPIPVVEPHVFPSTTHPGQWFWLAADGRNGWASDHETAERRAGITHE